MFQSTPRLVSEGNLAKFSVLLIAIWFQSTPRLVSEGNSGAKDRQAIWRVSIHPPLGQRGEPSDAERTDERGRFQSTPRLVSEGNTNRGSISGRWRSFNPPPAWSARGTRHDRYRLSDHAVSIHPPLGQRGERPPRPSCSTPGNVSIHPPLGQRGERPGAAPRSSRCRCFNPPPAWSARGTFRGRPAPHGRRVSIHPPLGQRGEPQSSGSGRPPDQAFQSTPRLVSEGNPQRPAK